MSFVALAVAAVVTVGATAGSNAVKGHALSKSAGIRSAAYDQLQPLNASELNSIATKGDLDRMRKSLDAQRQLDPTFAAIRDAGSKNLLAGLRSDSVPGASDKATKEIGANLDATKGADDSNIAALLDKVKEDLAAGATLPPEFQAELVRSGLEKAGTQGLNVSGNGAAGSQIRELLGSSGLALKENREANARANLGAVDAIRSGRQAALSSFAALTDSLNGSKIARGAGGVGLAQSVMPNIGLSGADLAGIYKQNNQLANAKILGSAGVNADAALQQGALTASTIGAAGAGATSLLGTPGAGSWISGLFTQKQPYTSGTDSITPWK